MTNRQFGVSLRFGQQGESLIAKWFRHKGYTVMPVYDVGIHNGKGPQLFAPEAEWIAPDMFVFRGEQAFWIEAKHKSAFSWHRETERWTTGIDRRHFEDYCKVDDGTPWPVWLLFLQLPGTAKDSPEGCPTGLYGNRLATLRTTINHCSDKGGGPSGMVYWAESKLIRLASLDKVIRILKEEGVAYVA